MMPGVEAEDLHDSVPSIDPVRTPKTMGLQIEISQNVGFQGAASEYLNEFSITDSLDAFENDEDDFADFASGCEIDTAANFSFDPVPSSKSHIQPSIVLPIPEFDFFEVPPEDLVDINFPNPDSALAPPEAQTPKLSSRCSDLWQSLAFNEDLTETRFNNRGKLRWKQSLMRRHCMLAMEVPFNLDEVNPRATRTIEKMASSGYEIKDTETIAKRFDATMAHSLCNIGLETLSSYSISDLSQLDSQLTQVLEEVSLSIEHWRSKLREVEENQDTYNKMIANLVSHTHKIKSPTTSPIRTSRASSFNKGPVSRRWFSGTTPTQQVPL